MKKFANAFALSVAAILASEGVVSSELGASQHEVEENAVYAVAAIESTNQNWVTLPREEKKASAQAMREFTARSQDIGEKVDKLLQSKLEQKFAFLNNI